MKRFFFLIFVVFFFFFAIDKNDPVEREKNEELGERWLLELCFLVDDKDRESIAQQSIGIRREYETLTYSPWKENSVCLDAGKCLDLMEGDNSYSFF